MPTVSTQLKERYGNNFELRNLRRMMQFAEQFTNLKIVVPLSRQLSWSHFVELLPLKTIESKLFYAQNASNNLYGIRELRRQLALKAYERANIADTKIIESTKIPFNTFKDPYILDFSITKKFNIDSLILYTAILVANMHNICDKKRSNKEHKSLKIKHLSLH